MAINILDGKLTGFITEVPAIVIKQRRDFRSIYETHRHRVYSLAFYATDNEMTAEEICGRVFCRRSSTGSASMLSQSSMNALVSILEPELPHDEIGIIHMAGGRHLYSGFDLSYSQFLIRRQQCALASSVQ